MIDLKNLKEARCPRCKGYGYIRGQKLRNGIQLENYKFNQHGLCFACKGAKFLHKTEDGKLFIREENGKVLGYDYRGKYVGILKNISTIKSEAKDIKDNKVKDREKIMKRILIQMNTGTVVPNDGIIVIKELCLERAKHYNSLIESGDKNQIELFLKTIVLSLEQNIKIINKLKHNKDKDIENFINIYEKYNSGELNRFRNKLKSL